MSNEAEAGVRPLVAVVIPTHNRRDALIRCLERVRDLDGGPHRAVVVCDGCTDGSQEAVRERFPDTLLVEGDGKLWWSGAVNAGIRAAGQLGAEYCCLLNDDVQPAPGMLDALLRAAERHPNSLIGARIHCLREPDRIWCAGGLTDWLGLGAYMRGNGQEDAPEWHRPAEVHWLPGMGTLIPASVLQRIGLMDAERFPQYFGDTDFSLRAHQRGIRVLVCPEAVLFNDVASTGVLLPPGPIDWKTAITILCSLRSHSNWKIRWRFWLRHCPLPLIPWQALRFYAPLLAAMAKKMTWDRLHRPRSHAQEPSA